MFGPLGLDVLVIKRVLNEERVDQLLRRLLRVTFIAEVRVEDWGWVWWLSCSRSREKREREREKVGVEVLDVEVLGV